MFQELLWRPITPIIALVVVLAGMGVVAPKHNSRTAVNAYAPTSQTETNTSTSAPTTGTRIIITTPAVRVRTPPPSTIPTTTSSLHYSVPASLRGDGGDGPYDD